MPIEYEAAAPVASAANVYAQAAEAQARLRQRQLAAAAAQGYGGHGGSAADDGVQAAVTARDQMYLGRDEHAADRQQAADMAAQAREGQARQEQQRLANQMTLQSFELSQQEQMRLARMKNAVGEVMADPTLAPDEKAALALKLKTGIDPMEHRLAQQKLATERMQKEGMVEQYNAQAALRNAEAKVTAQSAEQRKRFLPDDQAMTEISDHIRQTLPLGQHLPNELVEKMARAEALRQGLGIYSFQHGYGKFQLFNPDGSEVGKGDGSGGKSGKPSEAIGANNLTLKEYLKVHQEVVKEVARVANETKPDPAMPGAKLKVHPELEDEHVREGMVQTALAKRGLPRTIGDFSDTLESPPEKGKKKYKPDEAPWAAKKPAPAPEGGAATVVSNDGTNVPPEHKTVIGNFDVQRDRIASMGHLPPETRDAAVNAIVEGKKLVEKYPGKKPPEVVAKILELARVVEDALGRAGPAKPATKGVPDTSRWDF